MKTFTKIMSLVLALVLGLSCLTACGKGSFGSDTDTNYTKDNTEFFIGSTGPLTGDASSYGTSVQKGAKLAIDEINANGGLNGVKFKFDMKDDAAAADKAQTGYTALYEAGMQISIGSVTSGSCVSFATAAKENNLFLMTPSASSADVIAVGDNAFRVCFGDPQQGSIAADTLTKEYKKIGVIYDTSDTYSNGIYEAFEEAMTQLNKTKDTDYFVYSFTADTNKDFSAQVGNLKKAGCDVIFLPIYYTEAGLIAKAAAKIDYNVPIFGCDGLDGIKDQLDASVAASVKYITPFDANSTDDAVKSFVEAYKKANKNETPDQFAADGYDAIMIIYEAMKAAGCKDATISASDLCDTVTKQLLSDSFSFDGVTGKGMSWDKSGSCTKEPNIVTVDR